MKLSDIFTGDAPVYEIRRERRTVSGQTPLLCAEIEYPVFSASEEDAGYQKINEFYAELARRFFDWAEGSGRERAASVYDADADPQKRFRFIRFRCAASFLPGFCSEGLVSVAGGALLYRGRQPIGGRPLSRLFRTSDGRLMPQRPPRLPRNGDFYFSREGELIFREVRDGGISDAPAGEKIAEKMLNELKILL